MGRASKLTPEAQTAIVRHIRAGAFDWVAAQAVGITPKTFWNWMKWGAGGNDTYVPFFLEVSQAKADARTIAESAIFKDNPFAWLRYGPGRERPGEPGWTESKEITGAGGEPFSVRYVNDWRGKAEDE